MKPRTLEGRVECDLSPHLIPLMNETPAPLSKRKSMTYRVPWGKSWQLVPYDRGVNARGAECELRESRHANIVRVILSAPRDGDWRLLRATKSKSPEQRVKLTTGLRKWFRINGYTPKQLRVKWIIEGLSFRWVKK